MGTSIGRERSSSPVQRKDILHVTLVEYSTYPDSLHFHHLISLWLQTDISSVMDASTLSPPHSPDWIRLPPELTSMILLKLGPITILETAQYVCTTWHRICKYPDLWRTIDARDARKMNPQYYRKLIRHAVDRSRGRLLHISLAYFCDDDLLCYVAERSFHLKSLQVIGYYVSETVLRDSIITLSFLEELDFSYTELSKETVTSIGKNCPLLKTFKYNQSVYSFPCEPDDVAVAIAEAMPGLHQLSLIDNPLTNFGLNTILDCCHHLKSLDLRKCSGVDLAEEDMATKCSERIKILLRCVSPIDDVFNIFELFEDACYGCINSSMV